MFSNVEPIISVIIVPTGSSVDLRKYTRTCSNDSPNILELISVSYQWTRNGIILSETDRVLILVPYKNLRII